MSTTSCRGDRELIRRVLRMFKLASAKPVTISKNGRSFTFSSMDACAEYFSGISALSKSQIWDLLDNREKYICGCYIEYHD